MCGAESGRPRTFFSKFISTVPFWTIFTFQCSADRWALVGRLMIPRAYHILPPPVFHRFSARDMGELFPVCLDLPARVNGEHPGLS